MKEKTKEWGFFIAAFLIITWLLSFLAPSSETASPQPQMPFPDLSATDWIMAFVAIGSIPAALLTVYILQNLPQPAQQLQMNGGAQTVETETEATQTPMEERPIVFNGASPEVVNRLAGQRDYWQREAKRLQALLDARPITPEPAVEKELTYAAVIALIKAGGQLSINDAQKLVREHRGIVGRDYKPLQEVLRLLSTLSPTASNAPAQENSQAVHGKCERPERPVNGATGRSQLRRRGRGR